MLFRVAAHVTLLSLAMTVGSACTPDPKQTISVDRAEVFTRERLIARRWKEQQWLEKKLDETDELDFTAFQGLRDRRELDAAIGSVRAEFDPLGGRSAVRNDELAAGAFENDRLQQEVNRLNLQKQIDAILAPPVTPPPAPLPSPAPAGPSEAANDDTTPPAGVTPAQHTADLKALEEKLTKEMQRKEINALLSEATRKGLSPSPKDIVPTSARLHPQDVLNEKRAYRNAISAMLREEELDDTHDLLGRTIHTLKLDITVGGVKEKPYWAPLVAKVQCDMPTAPASANSGSATVAGQRTTCVAGDANCLYEHCLDRAAYNRLSAELERQMRMEALRFDGLLTANNVPQFQMELLIASVQEAKRYLEQDTAKTFDWTPEQARYALNTFTADKSVDRFVSEWKGRSTGTAGPEANTSHEGGEKQQKLAIAAKDYRELVAFKSAISESVQDGMPTVPAQRAAGQVTAGSAALILARYRPLSDFFDFSGGTPFGTAGSDGWIDIARLEVRRFVSTTEVAGATNANDQKLDQARSKLNAWLGGRDVRPYVYTIEPHQLAQNISDVSAVEELRSLSIQLAAAIPNAGLSAGGSGQFLNQMQERLHSIRRNPLVVGFSYANDNPSSDVRGHAFGWVFGGSFGVDDKGRPTFKHVTKTHAVQASLAIPAWWRQITLTVKRSWVDAEDGTAKREDSEQRIKIDLPASDVALVKYLMTARGTDARRPELDRLDMPQNFVVAANVREPQHLVIRGAELWRSPRVFLGTIEADEVTILPDMNGLRATFKSIPLPPDAEDDVAQADLVVNTSEGITRMTRAVRIVRSRANAGLRPFATLGSSYAVNGVAERGLRFTLDPLRTPAAYHALQLVLRPADAAPQSIPLDAKPLTPGTTSYLAPVTMTTALTTFAEVDLQLRLSPHSEWVSVLSTPPQNVAIFKDEASATPGIKALPPTITVNDTALSENVKLRLMSGTNEADGATIKRFFHAYPLLKGRAPIKTSVMGAEDAFGPAAFSESGEAILPVLNAKPLVGKNDVKLKLTYEQGRTAVDSMTGINFVAPQPTP